MKHIKTEIEDWIERSIRNINVEHTVLRDKAIKKQLTEMNEFGISDYKSVLMRSKIGDEYLRQIYDIVGRDALEFTRAIQADYVYMYFILFGKNILYPSPALCDMLWNTKTDIEMAKINFPFKSFYICIPFNTQAHDNPLRKGKLCGMAIAHNKTENRIVLREDLKFDDCMSVKTTGIELDGKTIDEFEKEYCSDPELITYPNSQNHDNETRKRMIRASFDYLNFAVNVMLYISSLDPDMSVDDPASCELPNKNMSNNKKKKAITNYKNSYRRIYLGNSIQGISEEHRHGLKMKVCFWVRGHWRRYEDERFSENVRGKPIWIKPFIKGKDFANKVHHKYILK